METVDYVRNKFYELGPLGLYTFQVLHYRVGSWPYPQTLDKAG